MLPAQVHFTQNEAGADVVVASLEEEKPIVNEDTTGRSVNVNATKKGRIRPIRVGNKAAFEFRSYRTGTSRAQKRLLKTTSHGEVSKNNQRLRVVFELPLGMGKRSMSDVLDDEVYEIREYLESAEADV